MADITNPTVTQFLNEAVRPVNERLRKQLRSLDDLLTMYDADVDALLSGAADSDVLDDGRDEVEGVPLRTVGELRAWLKVMRLLAQASKYEGAADNTALQTAANSVMAGVNAPLHLAKFTVRSSLFGD